MSGLFVGSPFWYAQATGGAFKLSDISGLILDANPATFTESGGSVTVAPDSSGAGNDLTISGTVPYTSSDADFNGNPSVTGGSGYLYRAAFAGGSISEAALYAVCKWPATATSVLTDGADATNRIVMRENSSVVQLFDGLTTLGAASKPDAGDICVFTARFHSNTLELLIERNGKANITASTSVGSNRGAAGIYLLSNYLGGAGWGATAARLALYDQAQTSEDEASIRSYLKDIYGITPA